MPESPFTNEQFELKYRVSGQVYFTAPTRLYEPSVSRRRNLAPLETALRRTGRWKQVQVGTLDLILLDANQVLLTLEEMAQQGVFCYEPA